MDRGRVGTLAIGNKTIRDQMIAHQQEVHMARINKIKSRLPGTGTLDNTAPVVIPAALINPRKIAKKKEFNTMTEKENRVLLKRISRTLTAPPKITDAEYQAMRKLIGNMKGGKQAYEEKVFARHHKQYLDHLKTMGPYYDPNEWELDYKRQKVQQMFMRQVPYERPVGHKTKELPPMKTLGTIHDKDDFSGSQGSQVNRVRARKHDKEVRDSFDSQLYDRAGDSADEGEEGEWGEQRVELACTHRNVNVATVGADGEETEEECWGEISCYLLDAEMLLICASLQEEEGGDDGPEGGLRPAHEAEAEIDIVAIASLRNLDGARALEQYLAGRTDELQGLARYISESVDLKIEEDVARVILNMVEEEDVEDTGGAFFMTEGAEDSDSASNSVHVGPSDLYDDLDLAQDSLGSAQQDAYQCAFEEVRCPVRLVGGGKKTAGRPPKPDFVYVSADVSCEVDQIVLSITVTKESNTQFREQPAVKAGESFSARATLPSIMQADGELMHEYFQNLSENLEMETHILTGKNRLEVLA